jgi:hypothetical protein
MLDVNDRATPHNGRIPRYYSRGDSVAMVCGFAPARHNFNFNKT